MNRFTKLYWLLIAIIVATIFSAIAYYFFKTEANEIRDEKFAYLAAIADLKTDEISNWYVERLSEVHFFPKVGKVIKSTAFLLGNTNENESKKFLDETLRPIQQRHEYNNIFITDIKHNILFSLNETYTSVDSTTAYYVDRSLVLDSVLFVDFYFDNYDAKIYLDIISPIKDNNGSQLGAIVFRFDPREYLYPLIQKWPTPSTTAECYILRNEGTHVRLLSDVKFKNNSALKLAISLKDTSYISVKGARGNKGILEGIDYRGVKVLASVKKIAGTDWFLVSKVDQDEIYEDLRYRGGSIVLITIIAFFLFGTVIMYLYKYRQSQIYKRLFLKEKELAETREEYKTTLYSIGDGIITTDELGRVKQMNVVAEELTGWKERNAIGKKLEEIFKIINEDNGQPVPNPVKRVLQEGSIIGLANHTLLINKDGKKIPISDSGSPIKNQANKIVGVIIVFRDQTEERAKEKEIYESNEKFSKIFQHSSDSITLTELATGKIIEVNDGFEQMFGYNRNEIIGTTTSDLNLWANPNDRKVIVEELKLNKHIKNYEATGNRKDGSKLTALISGEILTFNNVVHILFTMKDISERKHFEKNLAESEEKFRKAFITSPDSIVINRIYDGEYISVNQGFNAITGYTSEEVVGKNSVDIDIWETMADREAFYNMIKETGFVKNYEAKFRIKNGSVRIGSMSAAIIELNGEPHIISITRDITEQKLSDQNLKESEEKFRKAFLTSPDPIAINKFPTGEYVLVNQGFTDVTGYTTEEVIGKNYFDINLATDGFKERIKTLIMNEGTIKSEEVSFKTKYGDNRIGSISASLIELNGKPHLISMVRDITDQKIAVEKLRLSETNLKNSQKVALVGHYDLNVKSGEWTCSEMLDEIFGIDKNYAHDIEGWSNLLHPDDRQRISDHLLIEVIQNKNDFNKEYRIIRVNDKQIRWIHGLGKIEVDEYNNPDRMFGTIQDITEQKKAEEEKFKAKVHFQKIIENASDGIVLISAEGKFKYVSPSAKRIFNHPLDKRVEQEPHELTHPDDLPFVIETLNEIVKDPSKIQTIEYRFRDYNGEYIWIESTFNNLLNEPSVESIVINFRDVSFRKKAEKELLEKFKLEEQISKIARTAPGGLCTFKLSPDGIVSMPFVSNAWCELYALSQEDVALDASIIFSRMHPDDVNHVDETIKKSATTMDDWRDEFRIVNPVRGIIWVEGHSTPSKEDDGSLLWHGFITDITARKNAEERLRTLSRAVEQSPAIIVITDTNGDIEFVNPKFTEVTGYTLNEVLGRNPRILKSGNTSRDEYKTLWKTISDGKEWRGEFLNKKKNGELYWESAYISPILNESGKIINYIALKEDINERKKLIADLIEAKEKAEEMNRIKAYFFANMSHELRTPFVGIVGFSELLAESLSNPDEKEMAEQILKSSKRLTDTLNKILNVTRLEFDKIELRIREVNIIDLVNQLVTLFSKSAQNKNLELRTSFGKDKIVIKTDGRLLEEILSNLINNAIKYTHSGYIEVNADLKIENNTDVILIQVKDTGVGIPKNKQEIIWQEFRQVSEGMNRSFEGTGLGLTIIKKYVETLKGTISLDSEIGKGSTFIIIIPVQKIEEVKAQSSDANPGKQNLIKEFPKNNKPKILYVEDDVIALSYVDKVLRVFYQVDTAYNANTALDLVNKNNYEAMLLDINLGKGIDGVELMQLIRKNEKYKKVPIVAVTAYAAESDRLEFLAKGFSHYLSKPFTSVDLRGLLSKIFNA